MNKSLISEVPLPDWPIGKTQKIGCCPLCGSRASLLYTDQTDIVFRCAPGKWIINQCRTCGSGYLDPRPTPDSIHLAYEDYYTHDVEGIALQPKKRHVTGQFRRAIDGRNKLVYGIQSSDASIFWGAILHRIPYIGAFFDPFGSALKPPRKPNDLLLDFGCGNGEFMSYASQMGWKTLGVDFDKKAILSAEKKGHHVRLGGFDVIENSERFSAINMSHVIEHVHDPIEILKKCFKHLEPGGELHIETPNFDSYGRLRWGQYWRGLECPRHLVIFNRKSLDSALKKVGFHSVKCNSRQLLTMAIYGESKRLFEGKPMAGKGFYEIVNFVNIYDGLKAIFNPRRTEFVRFVARKNDLV